MKILNYFILLGCFASVAQNQNIIFHDNVNFEAHELKQNLNASQDSLFLESDNIIRDVEIFSNDYDETIKVDGNKTSIDLNKLPVGNFIVKARMGRKHIVMSLEKTVDNQLVDLSANDLLNKMKPHSDIQDDNVTPAIKLVDLVEKREASYYWVVHEINSNSGSSKSMRLENKAKVDRLIARNKLEQKSNSGKHNKLYVYEIYNLSQFMNQQSKNSDFYRTMNESKHFNALPYYYTNKDKRDAVAIN